MMVRIRKRSMIWAGAIFTLICVVCVLVLWPFLGLPYYKELPELELPDNADVEVQRYRDGRPRRDQHIYYVGQATYTIAGDSLTDIEDVVDRLNDQIVRQGWTDYSDPDLLPALFDHCYSVRADTTHAQSKVYVETEFINSAAVNYWATTHLCLFVSEDETQDNQVIVIATFTPTFISAFID